MLRFSVGRTDLLRRLERGKRVTEEESRRERECVSEEGGIRGEKYQICGYNLHAAIALCLVSVQAERPLRNTDIYKGPRFGTSSLFAYMRLQRAGGRTVHTSHFDLVMCLYRRGRGQVTWTQPMASQRTELGVPFG